MDKDVSPKCPCLKCQYMVRGNGKIKCSGMDCDIPADILTGKNKHTTPFNGQKRMTIYTGMECGPYATFHDINDIPVPNYL